MKERGFVGKYNSPNDCFLQHLSTKVLHLNNKTWHFNVASLMVAMQFSSKIVKCLMKKEKFSLKKLIITTVLGYKENVSRTVVLLTHKYAKLF